MELEMQKNPRLRARALFWQGWPVAEIARYIGDPESTVRSWKSRDGWDQAPLVERLEASYELRLIALIGKEAKTGGDYKEIDLLMRQVERCHRVRKYQASGREADLNPALENRTRGRVGRGGRPVAEIDTDAVDKLRAAFMDNLFGYQECWHQARVLARIRNILKSRQIGATWYFAREALLDAAETGANQIFLSASRAQAHVFREYIVKFMAEATGIELRGDPIILPHNGATLYFLGTNSRTAQSYHGNLYFDEYFWVHRFLELRKVASGMAMHKRWRQTYFSTPSSVQHQAYRFWNGSLFNRGRARDQHIQIDTSHAALVRGAVGADGQWRQIVTVEDAVAGGCDLFDIDQLRLEYSPEEFSNLLMCEFMDDSLSVFPFADVHRCMVDSWVEWDDFKPFAARPYGDRVVWIGYDPSHSPQGDSAAIVVVAPPLVPGGKFRVLEKHRFRGADFQQQAAFIERLTQKYSVSYIGIDATGQGEGVFQLVRQYFPAARKFTYSPDLKSLMVLKAQDVICAGKGRLEFDAGSSDLAQSLMSIRRVLTPSGTRATYDSLRDEETGHGDLAWALLHTLYNEPLEGSNARNSSRMEIF